MKPYKRILKTKTGRLFHGDCLDVLPRIPAGCVDMILCDLPYGTTQNKWDSIIPFEPLWREYWRIAKPNAAIVLTASQPFTSALITSNTKMFKYCWVWHKNKATGHLMAKIMPMKNHEDIIVFSKNKCVYNPQNLIPYNKITKRGSNGSNFHKSGTENFQEFTNYPRSILSIESDNNVIHPTQKPVALFEYLIKTYTNDDALILDNCSGSGTTAIAAINLDRRWICIEKDEAYVRASKQRIKAHIKGLKV